MCYIFNNLHYSNHDKIDLNDLGNMVLSLYNSEQGSEGLRIYSHTMIIIWKMLRSVEVVQCLSKWEKVVKGYNCSFYSCLSLIRLFTQRREEVEQNSQTVNPVLDVFLDHDIFSLCNVGKKYRHSQGGYI